MAIGTTAAVALGVTAVGAATSAFGAYRQSQAAKDQAQYTAAVNRNNRLIAQREAEDIRKRGEIEADAHRRKVSALKGKQRANFAARGIELGVEGTAEDILSDTALLGELDIETIKSNAERAAYGREVEAMNFGAQAGLYDAAADAESPFLSGATSLLSGAGSFARQWYTYQDA